MPVRINNNSSTPSPTFSTTNDTAENAVLTSTETRPRIFTCYFDMTNITVATVTVRLKLRIDGTNYITIPLNENGTVAHTFTTASDVDIVRVGPIPIAESVRITFQLSAGEAVVIPYQALEELI